MTLYYSLILLINRTVNAPSINNRLSRLSRTHVCVCENSCERSQNIHKKISRLVTKQLTKKEFIRDKNRSITAPVLQVTRAYRRDSPIVRSLRAKVYRSCIDSATRCVNNARATHIRNMYYISALKMSMRLALLIIIVTIEFNKVTDF